VKRFARTTAPNNRGQHFRIGFSDLEPLWDAENEKYKVCCRSVHLTKAALYIGYVQLLVSFMFCLFFAYHYVMAVSGQMSADHWLNQYTARYMSQLMLTVSLQVIIVVVMIHGIKTEKKSFLLPYIVYAAIAVLTGAVQVVSDLMYLDKSVSQHADMNTRIAKSQFMSHVLRTVIQAWCLSVVWRCYGYLTEKKVARQIREQLSTTATAFHYPENLLGYSLMPQPPPYVDTVSTSVASPIIIGPVTEKPPQQKFTATLQNGQENKQ